ncbi:hypothetical protein CORC01_12977 [Colletotrichum orchidophilum]|uniref:Uncharacterized protein n=1 Tax=Colletotrichum orchidophilum TaxID=1209926 RepID=A0A1G4ARG7_9PEZI|nr:uncharacterized protein CORC01_12977 [Colletotrichum orchidophilum]OHE91750.1 hypothetical protein CORC01_12977 [Colletotrichum orchidophilum]
MGSMDKGLEVRVVVETYELLKRGMGKTRGRLDNAQVKRAENARGILYFNNTSKIFFNWFRAGLGSSSIAVSRLSQAWYVKTVSLAHRSCHSQGVGAQSPRVAIADFKEGLRSALVEVLPPFQLQHCIFHADANVDLNVKREWLGAVAVGVQDEMTSMDRRSRCAGPGGA